MLRLTRNLAIALAMLSVSAVFAGPTTPSSKPDPMVYATEQGKRYHVKNCRLKHGSKGMKLSEAKRKGYTPCAVCKPPK